MPQFRSAEVADDAERRGQHAHRLFVGDAVSAPVHPLVGGDPGSDAQESERIHGMVGAAARMLDVHRVVARVAPTTSTVLIQGETGTGKELIARAIHAASRRSDRPFVTVDCSALAETLLES